MKLYRIRLKGLHGAMVGNDHSESYVIARDPTDALNKVQSYLNERDIGFKNEREMDSIELLAEEGGYPKHHVQLFL